MFEDIVSFIKSLYPDENPVPLHAPRFIGNEKKYLNDCIDTTYVSYVGKFVNQFENHIQKFTGADHALAVVSGTAALHMALILVGVSAGDEVITQPLTFVATPNAISYCSATPVFVDVERFTLGLNPDILSTFLNEFGRVKKDGRCYNRATGKRISACVPMHTFGHPCRIDQVVKICRKYHIPVVEDAAEALGSFYTARHVGLFGDIGILSFNGNKTVTTGGGGMIITTNKDLALSAKHLCTTAKRPHPWEFYHDKVGYNYRMPNINAAVGCAQMETLPVILENKRASASLYAQFFETMGLSFIQEPANSRSNYWLNAILLADRKQRDEFLKFVIQNGVQIRPVWRLMTELPMYRNCQSTKLDTALWLQERLVNLPSSMRIRS